MVVQIFGEGIWIAEGPTVSVAGFRYPTRMAVIALPDGGVLLWSPVTLTPELQSAVEAIGPVRHIVAPNHLHHLALADWRKAHPGALLHASPGLRAKRPDLSFDADLTDAPRLDWRETLDQVLVRGNRITTEAVFFHRPSGTILFCDLLQHFPKGWFTGWRALVARLDLMTATEPSVPRKFRLATTDRAAANASISRILDWPAQQVLMAHGVPVTENAPAFLARAFRWLTG